MSHALSVESSKSSFSRTIPSYRRSNSSFPMHISYARLGFTRQKKKDYDSGACFICQKKGCRRNICQNRNNVQKTTLDEQENQPKDTSQ